MRVAPSPICCISYFKEFLWRYFRRFLSKLTNSFLNPYNIYNWDKAK